MSKHH